MSRISKISYNLTHNVGRIVVTNFLGEGLGTEYLNPVIEELPVWLNRLQAEAIPDGGGFRSYLETEGSNQLLSMDMLDYVGEPVSTLLILRAGNKLTSGNQLNGVIVNGIEVDNTQFMLFATSVDPVSTQASFSFLVPKIGTVFANDYDVVPSTGVTPAGAPGVQSVSTNYRLTFNNCTILNGVVGQLNIVPKV